MPKIYLSPSTQEKNLYVTGNTEEYYMNKIADAMEPYLIASGIEFTRNTPYMTAASSIRQSNAGNYDLHLALHSNAAPDNRYGEIQGTDVYYSPNSVRGRRAANIIARNLKLIYPVPELVRTVPTTYLGEVKRTRAPAVFIEFAYHDNLNDANWITNNINAIAENVVLSLTEYFGIPFVYPTEVRVGTVRTRGTALNIREKPSVSARIVGKAYNGTEITVTGETDGWYVVIYNGIYGYANKAFIEL